MSNDTVDLFYNEYGDGPPLVILHGLLGASGNWHTLSRNQFGEHFSVFAVDLRNHGRSPHADRFDYAAMVEDLEHFLDQQGLTEASVIGHSMGGKVAMHLALSHPDLVSQLVIADIAPKAYPPGHEPIFQALKSVDFAVVRSREDVDAQLSERISSRPVRQFLMKNLAYDSDSGAYSWQMALDEIHANYHRINEAVERDDVYDGPTLVVRGERSDYVAEEDQAPIRRLFPAAEFASIEGAGHWVHADSPDAFAETVLAFLTR